MKTIDGDALIKKAYDEAKGMAEPYDDFGTLVEWLVDKAPTIEPEPKWIPVSKELPPIPTGRKEYFLNGSDVAADEYIVMIDGEKLPTSLLWSGDTWFDVDGIGYKVLAWYRLPELYREEGD